MAGPAPRPVIPVTCCLPGFTYDPIEDNCFQNSDPTVLTDAVPCGCCPPGYTYINSLGQFIFQDLSIGVISGPTPLSQWYGTCVQLVNRTWVNAPGPDPIACPCCPTGFKYYDDFNFCVEMINPKHIVEPVPCIPCVCTSPPPPPPCVGCANQNLISISFAWDNSVKNCVDCAKQGEPRMTSDHKFNAFLPYFLIDPIINFRLDD